MSNLHYAPEEPQKKSWPRRHPVWTALFGFGALGLAVLALIISIVGAAVNQADKTADGVNVPATSAPITGKATLPPAPKSEGKDWEYSGLKVTKDPGMLGTFAGTIVIKNNTDDLVEYLVEVTVFKGSQDVGQLLGNIKVKANSSGTLKLTSLDDFVKGATDYQVSVTPGL